MNRKSLLIKGISLLLLVGLMVGFKTHVSDHFFELAKNLEIFGKIYKQLDAEYVDEMDPTRTMRKGIDAMMASLDPYTVYYSAGEVEDYRFMNTGQYEGIGLNVQRRDKRYIISEIFKGYPAQEAGLKAGDEILKVNQETIKGTFISDNRLKDLIKGQEGTEVTITIQREGENSPQILKIPRKQVKNKNVPFYQMIDQETGYIVLTGFMENASSEIKDAWNALKEKNPGMKNIVLDLRGNPGGLLEEAVSISGLFLPQGSFVVETKGRNPENNKKYTTKNDPIALDMPIAVLIDSKSASASEIVSGVIQDLDRGVIIGQRSYGKGLVQVTRPVAYGSQMKFTISKYFIPSGRCIQAIDYASRNPDGSVGKIADSLKKPFQTKAGRTVYDGGGIEPDLLAGGYSSSPVLSELQKQYHIFDFCTLYAQKHPTIAEAGKFVADEALFQDFIRYLEEKNFSYEAPSEKQLVSLQEEFQKENVLSEVQSEYNALLSRVKTTKKAALIHQKSDILKLLKEEILRRYYYHEGVLENALQQDEVIQSAVTLFSQPEKYRSLLKK